MKRMPRVDNDQLHSHRYHVRMRLDSSRCPLCVVEHLGEPGRKTLAVVDDRGRLVLETDDWVGAQEAALSRPGQHELRHVYGTHPTHTWGPPEPKQGTDDPRCTKCGAWDNTSYGSQSPCGYEWSESLVAAIEWELAARETS